MPKAINIEINDKELFKGKLSGDLMDSVRHCTDSLDEIIYQRNKLIKALWAGYDSFGHNLNYAWECKDSPAGWCVYHRWHDVPCDQCLFCGEPSERK